MYSPKRRTPEWVVNILGIVVVISIIYHLGKFFIEFFYFDAFIVKKILSQKFLANHLPNKALTSFPALFILILQILTPTCTNIVSQFPEAATVIYEWPLP
ncbi:hypothetical protein C1N53_12480 [Pontibacter sp. SGAir0037]|nr:hypothetical protein C1N53_12480 [Pontibacter sp. SGAir0037]